MDSITHIALGACMGEAFAGKALGKKAMVWGALAQSIPDIDFIASFWLTPASNLLAHRGFTHSFLFCLIITPLLAFAAEYYHRPHNIQLKKWILFFGGVIFFHLFIDAFNNYGVGWFEPFNHNRISFNAIYVADPFFSVWPAIACFALIRTKSFLPKRKKYWQVGLLLCLVYLMYCLINKLIINKKVQAILKQEKIMYTEYFTTPAPLQNWLWYVVVADKRGFYIGFKSIFDANNTINFTYFNKNDSLLTPVKDHLDVYQLKRFSKQYYTVEKWNDTLVLNDLRFGQILGWQNNKGKFVFHYYLLHPNENKLVVQRGRFEGWNYQSIQQLIKKIVVK